MFGLHGINALTAVPAGRTSRQSSAGEQAALKAAAHDAAHVLPVRRRLQTSWVLAVEDPR
jgi:hypothetical protein